MNADAILPAAMFAAALLYSSAGYGGASAYMAVMALAGIVPETMKPAALSLNAVVSSIATVQYGRAGCIPARLFLPLAVASAPAACIAGRIMPPAALFNALVGLSLCLAAVRVAIGARADDSRPLRSPGAPTAAAVGAGIGFLAGLTGIGGGIYLSPISLLLRWESPRRTSGLVAAFILVNSIAGLAGYVPHLSRLPAGFGFWIIAVTAGGLIGSELGRRRLAPAAIRYVLSVILILAAGRFMNTGRPERIPVPDTPPRGAVVQAPAEQIVTGRANDTWGQAVWGLDDAK